MSVSRQAHIYESWRKQQCRKPLTGILKRSIRISPPESSRVMFGIIQSERVRSQNSSRRFMERWLNLEGQVSPKKF